MAEKHIKRLGDLIIPDVTYMFEICDPEDPHIIYEKFGAYLIGARSTKTGKMFMEDELDVLAEGFDYVMRPAWSSLRFGDLVREVKNCRHEGFVVHGTLNTGKMGSMKIKSPYYLTAKFFARVRGEKLLALVEDNNIKQRIEEEYYPLVDYLVQHKESFVAYDEQMRLQFIRAAIERLQT